MTSNPHVLGSVCQLYNVNTLSTTEILNFYVWKSSLGSQISNLAVLCFDFGLLIQHYGNPLYKLKKSQSYVSSFSLEPQSSP